MHRRQPLPRVWMMTAERQNDELWNALARLPKGAGIVFRHYGLPLTARRRLFLKVRAIAKRRRLVVMLAGSPALAAAWGADGSHSAGPKKVFPHLLRSAPAHNEAQIRLAEKSGADFIFLSPVFATRSHPQAPTLGPVRYGLASRRARLPVIALGGMNAARAQRLAGYNIYGWAGIDAWSAEAG